MLCFFIYEVIYEEKVGLVLEKQKKAHFVFLNKSKSTTVSSQ
jgi:hypothetical protein